ncbi:bromodomain-containing protein [Toxoplasma gondii TgCatPRC2]|uniref:Bromodomain-containing protein n=4 Tax=Toxoplasma gondii TaxID=5811 RepID=A0A151HN91_TOXGO|nr:bromodomain-containing protein [Toxoplasma gondii ME49]EPT29757.1 bromodomain-containing protein [Toxoplasma gondii ME49]KYF40807.1 bromodomain-containing protein [Toxoplasma gondii ARI]KYK70721.1 bromodomain-containing protein [Toxoplasma gondii TgCatPRC2]PIM05582.1 bromodomain-containing protein [Toxoplasma gondii COUG]|eukprot:XP_002365458.1 bromodomain-containing protein [Toxoplasma gondii ME49]
MSTGASVDAGGSGASASPGVSGASPVSPSPGVSASPRVSGASPVSSLPGASLVVSPFVPLFRIARHEPVSAVKEAFDKTLEKHRREVAEQNPGVSEADLDALQMKQIQEQHLLVDPTSRGTLLFEVAQRAKDEEAVELAQFLVDDKRVLAVTQRDRMQQTCLFYAAREGHVALCRFFIERGCDPNAQDTVGQTCLFYASREGRAACIAEILDRGGNPNLIDINRQSCLFYAARDNRLDAVRVLLEKGADPQVKDTLRKTAWHFAKANNHVAVCALLKGAGGAGAQAAAAGVGAQGVRTGPSLPGRTCSISSLSSFSGAAPASPNAGAETPEALDGARAVGPGRTASGVHGEAVCVEEVPQRKKYRLQFRPLPEDCPDLWLNAENEKLTEFERLFPALSVWRREESQMGCGEGVSAESSQNHYDAIHSALLQNSQQAALGAGSGTDLLGLWQSAASALLSELSKYEGGHIFEKPVDPKTAPGYYDVVTRPMSLSCIKAKIKKSDYTHPQQFLKDVEQVFINCEIYNQQGSWVWSIGKNMQKFFTNQVMITRFRDYVDKYDKIYSVLAECEEENRRAKASAERNSSAGEENERGPGAGPGERSETTAETGAAELRSGSSDRESGEETGNTKGEKDASSAETGESPEGPGEVKSEDGARREGDPLPTAKAEEEREWTEEQEAGAAKKEKEESANGQAAVGGKEGRKRRRDNGESRGA